MPLPAKAAARAASVLRLVAAHPDERFTLSGLADELEISNASIHAVLSALTDAGLLVREEDKTFRLGHLAIGLGTVARHQNPEVDAAILAAETLAVELGRPVVLSRLDEGSLVVLLGLGSDGRLQTTPAGQLALTGARMPLAAPYGAIHMAWAPPQDVLRWLQAGGISATSPMAVSVREALGHVRERGWSASVMSVEQDQVQNGSRGHVTPDPETKVLLAGAPPEDIVPVDTITVPASPDGQGPLTVSVLGFQPMTGAKLYAMARKIMDAVQLNAQRALV